MVDISPLDGQSSQIIHSCSKISYHFQLVLIWRVMQAQLGRSHADENWLKATQATCVNLWKGPEFSGQAANRRLGGNVCYLFAKFSVVGGDAGDAAHDTSGDTPSDSTHNTRGHGHGGGTSGEFPRHDWREIENPERYSRRLLVS